VAGTLAAWILFAVTATVIAVAGGAAALSSPSRLLSIMKQRADFDVVTMERSPGRGRQATRGRCDQTNTSLSSRL
jgi:hypothetical protein